MQESLTLLPLVKRITQIDPASSRFLDGWRMLLIMWRSALVRHSMGFAWTESELDSSLTSNDSAQTSKIRGSKVR